MRCILLITSLVLWSINGLSQCNCDPLPAPSGLVETVSNVSELQNALHIANQNNGNTTILLKDGTYELTNNLLYIGSNMVNLTIRSESGDRDNVIIKGQGMGGNVGWIFNVAADNFTAADMTIGWIGNHAIQVHAESDADDALIQNIRFVDIREQMIKVSGSSSEDFSDRGVVQCCEFEFTAGVAYQYYTGGVDAHKAKDWIIRNNTFKHIRSPDSGLAEHAIHFWSNSENTLVENNTIIDCDRGIGFGLGDRGHNGGMIRNNWVHTTRDVGIGLENSGNTKVYHNTIHTVNYFNSIEYRFEGTSNAHIANNLTNENIASRNGGTGTVESNYKFTNNNIFIDSDNYDYHLSGDDPGITDQGLVLTDVDLDFDCHPRNTDGMPDIGSDELNSTTALIEPYQSPEIKLYPNPNNGHFTIELEQDALLLIYDPIGNLHLKTSLSVGINSINLEKNPAGIYFLNLIFNTKIQSHSCFVKTN